ncbi:MAG: HlyD family efflux transporter periplasmic adaptor subunit [Cellulosilyticaceae bacterium]
MNSKNNKKNKNRKKTVQHKNKGSSRSSATSVENLDEYRRKKETFNPYGQNNPYKTKPYTNPYGNSDLSGRSGYNYTTPPNTSYDRESYNPYSNTGRNYANPYGQSTYNKAPYQESPERRRQVIKEQNKMSRKEWVKAQNKKKRRLKQKVALLFIATLSVVFIIFKAVDYFSYPAISYQTVKSGIINNAESMEGFIVRNEKVYNSNANGSVYYIAGEGDKVGKAGEVCVVSDANVAGELQQDMGQVENALYNAQDKREDLSSYQKEIYDINTEISAEVRNFYHDRKDDETNNVYALRKHLDKLLQSKINIYATDTTSRTENIQKERTNLASKLSAVTNAVKAPQSGIVSYMVDGAEEKLSLQTLKNMQYDDFKKIMDEDILKKGNKSILEASKGKPLYKLVTQDTWYFVTYVQKDKADEYKQNQVYQMNADLQGANPIKFTLKTKVEEKDRVQLVFEASEQVAKFLPYRIINVSPSNSKEEGLKIPLQAIVEQNTFVIPQGYIVDKGGEKGVYAKHGEAIEFVNVSVAMTDGENTYIVQEMGDNKKLVLGDSIKKPEKEELFKIEKVTTSKGVYVVNGKYAQFKPIEIAIENKDYAIVKPSPKTKLKELDQIISNPKSVSEDQLLKYMNVQNQKLK